MHALRNHACMLGHARCWRQTTAAPVLLDSLARTANQVDTPVLVNIRFRYDYTGFIIVNN